MTQARFTSWLADSRASVGRFFREHTTLGLTLFYLFFTVIGAVHEFFFYLRFRVNILQFADAPDFLLAAIRQPLVVVFTVLPLVMLWVLDWIDRGVAAGWTWYRAFKSRQEGHPSTRALQHVIYPAFIAIYFLLFTIKLSQYGADRIKQGRGRPVAVRLNEPGEVSPALEGTLIGTTAKYVFLFQVADSSTHVVPVESMVEMRMLPRKRRP